MRKSCSGSWCLGLVWDNIILPRIEDPRNCVDPRNLVKSMSDQKLGMLDCVFSLYNKMKWRWDDVYLFQGSAEYILPVTLSTFITQISLNTCHCTMKMYLEAVMERVCRCTWRPWSCGLGGHNCASLEIHLEAVIERIWRCTRGRDWVNREMHLEAIIERVGRYIWRQWIRRQWIWRR